MNYSCSKNIPLKIELSKLGILQVVDTLKQIAEKVQGYSSAFVSFRIDVSYGGIHAEYETVDDLKQELPPIIDIDAFAVCLIHNAFHFKSKTAPEFNLYLAAKKEDEKTFVSATAEDNVSAQELFLASQSALSAAPEQNDGDDELRELEKRDDADSNNKEPKKFYKSGVFWGAVGGISAIASAVISLLIHFGVI